MTEIWTTTHDNERSQSKQERSPKRTVAAEHRNETKIFFVVIGEEPIFTTRKVNK